MQTLEKILEEIEQEKLKHWDSSERLERDKLIGWCFDKCADIISDHMNDGWIPVEEQLPEDDSYILLSFDNFTIPIIGRYEERKEGGLSTFQLLHDVEKEMSKEERKQVMIENAINLKTMCDYVVSCSYLDIVLIICMLRDYIQLIDERRADDIQWSVYYRGKFLNMADRLSRQIEYDYDAAKERCLKKQQKKENARDIGEDAMTLAVKYGKGKKKGKKGEQR